MPPVDPSAMTDLPTPIPAEPAPRSEPALNIPPATGFLVAALILAHIAWIWVPEGRAQGQVLALFAFVPERFLPEEMAEYVYPGGPLADLWVFVTYAFLHADVTHLGFNLLGFLAFAAAVEYRVGGVGLVVLFVAGAVAGAALHLVLHFGEAVPMVGASASVSAMTGAAIRFVFQPGGPIRRVPGLPADFRVPALPILRTFADPRVVAMTAAWFGLNFLVGAFPFLFTGDPSLGVAWEAHVGGFVCGFLGLSLTEPRRRH